MSLAQGFRYVAASDARVLILGSMPGNASLQAQRYYANPRNHFWPIVLPLCGVSGELDYEQRLAHLRRCKIALRDVLAECQRQGSLDSNIEKNSLRCNNFADFFAQHASVCCVAFNGNTAAQLYRRHVLKTLPQTSQALKMMILPSTSPAHASLTLADKYRAWQAITPFIEHAVEIVAPTATR